MTPSRRIPVLALALALAFVPVLAVAGDDVPLPPVGQWTSLFNGKDLTGWTPKIKGYALGENFGNTFRVADGAIKVAYDQYPQFDARYGHLFYKHKFSAYRLRVEYRFVGEQCKGGSGWACNEASVIHSRLPEPDDNGRNPAMAAAVRSLERGCALGFSPACENVLKMLKGSQPESAPPTLEDYPIILRGSKQAVTERSPSALYALACRQGWPDVCGPGAQASGN